MYVYSYVQRTAMYTASDYRIVDNFICTLCLGEFNAQAQHSSYIEFGV
jgi:hypothetical protein